MTVRQLGVLVTIVALACSWFPVVGQGRSPVQRGRPANAAPRTRAHAGHPQSAAAATFPYEYRRIDGTGNNYASPEWGAAEVEFLRIAEAAYADGVSAPAGTGRPSPREVSNAVASQSASIPNSVGATDYLWQWGQFLDHDIAETPLADPVEPFDIQVPVGDSAFDPTGTGAVVIPFARSSYDDHGGVRQQVNVITAYIDASNVYGSDAERASALRALDGSGRLLTSSGNLLPFNAHGLPNAPSSAPGFFLAGDIRANEQVGLTAMHTLFVREHNFWADQIGTLLGPGQGEAIYLIARAIVGAEMQAITYREFLPLLLGPGALRPYRGYRQHVDAGISNVFATAAYRVGHTMLSPQLLRVAGDGTTTSLPLAAAFFNPQEIVSNGIDPFLRGLASQAAQDIDPFVVDAIRNFLFGAPGSGGLDLASLNLQRGRDHGLPDFNTLREAMGLPRVTTLADIAADADIATRLQSVYDSVDDVDPWVGLLAEPHVPGALVGPTLHRVLADQFRRLRDGDRFWYQGYFPEALIPVIEAQTLAVIIRRNTAIGQELPAQVFRQ